MMDLIVRRTMLSLSLFFVLLLSSVLPAAARASDLLPPEQAFAVRAARDASDVLLQFQIADDYYLYRQRFEFRIFPADKNGSPEVLLVNLPAGKVKEDEFFGKVEIYRQNLDVRAALPPNAAKIEARWQGCADAGVCYPPQMQTWQLADLPKMSAASFFAAAPAQSSKPSAADFFVKTPSFFPEAPEFLKDWGLVGVLLAFFAAGLGLALTACVYPMVPVVSAIISGEQNLTRARALALALAYAQGVALVYAVIGAVAGLTGSFLTLWLQTAPVIVASALLLVLFALAMFDVISLQMPSWIQNYFFGKSQTLRGGKLFSVALMGAFSALILGPCVAPPLALALGYIGASGSASFGAVSLYVMALGLSSPLIVVGWLGGQILPRAGAWMRWIRSFFGVLMLVLALRLLEPFIWASLHVFLWGVLSLGVAFALGVLDRLPRRLTFSLRLLRLAAWVLALLGAAQILGALAGAHSPWQPLAVLAQNASSGQVAGQSGQNHAQNSILSAGKNTISPKSQFRKLENAQDLATLQASGRAFILWATADWCVICRSLERSVLADARLLDNLGDVELVLLDLTEVLPWQREILAQFHLFGPPAVLGFAGERENFRLLGEFSADDFFLKIQSLKSSAATPS